MKAPFIPKVEGDEWIKNFDKEFTSEKPRDSYIKVDLKKLKKFQKEFEDMDYNKDTDN